MEENELKYYKYLRTAHWLDKRKEALKFWDNACAICKSPKGLNVHHNNYDNLFKEKMNDIVVLCEDCHKLFHNRFNPEDAESEIEISGETAKPVSKVERHMLGPSMLEAEIVGMLYEGDKDIIEYIFSHFEPKDFSLSKLQILAKCVYTAFNNNKSIDTSILLSEIGDPEAKEFIEKRRSEIHSVSVTWRDVDPEYISESEKLMRYAKDAVRRYKLWQIDRKLKTNYTLIKESSEDEEIMRLMQANNYLLEEKKMIQKVLC